MSFMRKLMTHRSVSGSKTASSLCDLDPSPLEESDGMASGENKNENIDEQPNPDSMATENTDELDDHIDLFSIQANYRLALYVRNEKLATARYLERKKTWLKTNITQVCRETEEISRVIKSAQTQLPIVRKEYTERREQLEEKLNAALMKTKESDIKKREPVMYKRYMALKSAQEVEDYLNLLRAKQTILTRFELHALQKLEAFQVGQNLSTSETCRIKPALPKKPQRESLQSVYQDLLKSFVQTNPIHPPSPSDNAVENSISETNQSEEVDTDLGPFSLVSSSEPRDTTGANDGTLSLEPEV